MAFIINCTRGRNILKFRSCSPTALVYLSFSFPHPPRLGFFIRAGTVVSVWWFERRRVALVLVARINDDELDFFCFHVFEKIQGAHKTKLNSENYEKNIV